MNDLRKAAELALDALENHTAIKHPQQIQYRDDAIEALRQALTQPEQEPYGYFGYDFRIDAWIKNPDDIRGIPFYTAPPSIEAAVLAEREACAKVAKEFSVIGVANAIRARSEK